MKKLFILLVACSLWLAAKPQDYMPGYHQPGYSDTTSGGSALLDGLLACWELEETSGTTVNDSHADNDGTNTNCTIAQTGIVGYSYYFNGSNAQITMGITPFNFERTDSFSISLWISSNWKGSAFLENINPNDGGHYRGIGIGDGSDGKITFIIRATQTTNNRILITSTNAIPKNTWTNIVLTYDGSSDVSGVTLYFNGESQSYTTITNNLSTTTVSSNNLHIGSRDAVMNFYQGYMDQVFIWNRTLTASDAVVLATGVSYSAQIELSIKNLWNSFYENVSEIQTIRIAS